MATVLATNIFRIFGILILLSLLLIAAYPVLAENDATPAAVAPREKVQDRIEARKENVKERIETRKENMEMRIANMKERVASKEAVLKARLEAFKDKRKAQIAERVNTNLNRINQNQVEQMQKHISTMTSILDKLEARVNQSTPDIKNPALAKQAIADARAAISSASSALAAQTEKDYTITVTSENKVREDAKAMRDQLHTDLKALREQVRNTKGAVSSAIRVAKSGVKEGTSSGQQ